MKTSHTIQLLLLAAIWGSSFIFLKILTPVIGVSMTMGSRIILAAIVMISFVAFLKKLPDYTLHWRKYLVLGVLNLMLPFALVSYSIGFLNASLSSIINASTPLFTMIISSLWLRQRLSYRKLAGMFLGISGLTVLVGWMPLDFTPEVITSLVFSFLAALSYGLGNVYTRVYLSNAEPIKTATGQLTAAGVMAIPFLGMSGNQPVFDTNVIMALSILAVVCTALAYTLYFRLISAVGSANASVVSLLIPVFSVLWGVLFLHESITPAILVGLAMILGSLKIVLSSPR
jgi:drug/metabolite transporter (DMT)-like permease